MELTKNQNRAIINKNTSIWKQSNFIVLFISSAILAFGSKVYALTLPLTLYELTRSSVAMSTMRGIEFLPNLFLALFIGVFVDRVNKKRWSLWAIVFQFLILIMLYLATAHHLVNTSLYYFGGFFLMTFGYAYSNAQAGLVKQALPTQMITSANASLNFVFKLIGILGPTLTGILLMLSNVYDGLLFTAAAFSLSFLVMTFLRSEETVKDTKRKSTFLNELKEGWVELRKNENLWMMTLVVIFFNSTAGMVDTTVVFYAKDSLHLTDALLGLVFSIAGLGGLLGSLLIKKARQLMSNGMLITINILLMGLAYLLLFLFKSIYGLSIGLFLEGCFGLMASICIWSYRQESTPHHLIGRVTGLTGSFFKLGMPFAIFAAGWLIKWYNPSLIFLLASIINVIVFIVCRFSRFWDKAKPSVIES